MLRPLVESALTAPVGVEDHPVRGPAPGGYSHAQGVGYELGAHVVGHGVADQATGAEIEHGGQVEPALVGADVGDVPSPRHIRCPRVEPAADQIRQGWVEVRGQGGADLGRLVDPDDPVDPHQPLHPFVVHPVTLTSQLVGHAGRPVGAVGLAVDGPHDRHQLGVSQVPRRRADRLGLTPRVERRR